MLTRRPAQVSPRPAAVARSAGVCLSVLALAGCAAPRPNRTPEAPTVVAMSEAELDAFAARIAEHLRRVAADGRYRAPVGIAYPEVVAAPDLRPSARALAERLSEGLNDRLAGAALISDGRTPPAWHSRLELRRDPAGAEAQQLEFAVVDNRAGVEIARESTTFVPQPHAMRTAEPPIELGSVPPAAEPGPPIEAPRSPAQPPSHATAPPSSVQALAPRTAAPPAPQPAPPKPHPATPPPRRAQPRRAETPPPSAAPDEARPARTRDDRSDGELERSRKLRVKGDPRELAATVARRLPRYQSLTAAGELGEVVFVDDDSRGAVRLVSQGLRSGADGRLRAELELRAHDHEQDIELRVIFLDAEGQVVDATPVIPYRLINTYTSTVAVPAADGRAARYIVLIQED